MDEGTKDNQAKKGGCEETTIKNLFLLILRILFHRWMQS